MTNFSRHRAASATAALLVQLAAATVLAHGREPPHVDAQFSIQEGALRGFRYASLTGTVESTTGGFQFRLDCSRRRTPG